MTHISLRTMKRAALIAATVMGATLTNAASLHAEPFKVAADVGYAPWAMQGADGQVTGFVVDVANEMARRMGREKAEIIDVNFSAIFAGLFAGRYEAILAPMEITAARAEQMLFTEGYMSSGLALIIRSDDSSIRTPADLRGKVLATNNGSLSDTWATENAGKYGYTVQRYDKDSDAMQAVISGRADANIVDNTVASYAASKNRKIAVAAPLYSDKATGYAVRKDDSKLRAQMENAMECMKLDGTFQGIHQKWFGAIPDPEDAMLKVSVGYGPFGFAGYEATYHVPSCK